MLTGSLGNFFKSKVKGLVQKPRSPSPKLEEVTKAETPKKPKTPITIKQNVQSLPRLSLKKDQFSGKDRRTIFYDELINFPDDFKPTLPTNTKLF